MGRASGQLPSIAEEAEDEDATVGPTLPKAKKRKVLEFESAHLDSLPSAQMYERSYMHRDQLSHVEIAQAADFIITGSVDGHIKFWKKQQQGIEFAKQFRAHLGAIAGMAVSCDASLLASISLDRSVKVFDVRTLDMIAMLRLPFVPACVEWIFKAGDSKSRLAIADRDSPDVYVYDARSGSNDPLGTFRVGHAAPIAAMRFNAPHDAVISVDTKGVIEYWSASDHSFPEAAVSFRMKMETDLFALAMAKATASSIAVSQDGSQFAAFCSDRRVRVFWFGKGKLRRIYDETLETAQELQRSEAGPFRLEPIDFGRRVSIEREAAADPTAPATNAVFDESGNFIIYPTLLGIKVVNLLTNRVARIIGKVENTERFLRVALYQGGVARKAGAVARLPGGTDTKPITGDPTLVALAFQRQRFYLFTKREPEDTNEAAQGRDVFNEKPSTDLMEADGDLAADNPDALPRGAVLHTTRGDIAVKLFPDECPQTVENFATHARNGYYDNVIFHRVIKGFCIQTGDPLGDGTGGTSIWGREFADEFAPALRHDRAFTLSMANAGPNTNGSQFFITTVPTPWLDGKHTVYGRVIKGADVVQNIEKAKTNKDDKPYDDIKIINIEVKGSVE